MHSRELLLELESWLLGVIDVNEEMMTKQKEAEMCRFCKESEMWMKPVAEVKLDEEEYWEDAICEGGEKCRGQVSYIRYEWRVEDHLCDEHTKEQLDLLEEGLGEMLRTLSLEDSESFKRIDGSELCYECGRNATHAKLTLESYPLCDQHAKAGPIPGA